MVVILGGGLSGLSAAYYLTQRGVRNVKIIEASSRVGGWVQTFRNSDSGFLFEQGPRTIRPAGNPGANTLNLLEKLGLQEEIVPIKKTHLAATRRLLYVNNNLHVLPSSFSALFKKSPPFSKPLISALWTDYKSPGPKEKLEDDSIYNFAARRFGKEVADYAVSAMICGICAGSAKEISVKFLMKNLFELEQKYGSVTGGVFKKTLSRPPVPPKLPLSELARRSREEKWSIYSIRGGLETFVEALEENVQNEGVEILKSSSCESISFEESGVKLNINGQELNTKHLISSIPSFKLGNLIKDQHPKLENLLNSTPFVNVAVINLQYKGNVLKETGFGLLIPPCENLPILGIIFDSCCFDMDGNTVLTLMMGGHFFKQYFGENPSVESLLNIGLKYVSEIIKIDQKPDSFKVNILKNCIPQYTVGHFERLSQIRDYIQTNKLPLQITGASYDGVGVNDVIMSSKNVVEQLPEGV